MLFLCFVLLILVILWVQPFVSLFGEVSLLCYGLGDYSFNFMIDSISSVCLLMLVSCGSIALVYCFHYFSGDDAGSLLFPLVVWFLGVMGILVLTASPLFTLVLWEYLGLVSFFLILFYSNLSSLRASLITLFASRFGDVALFMIIMWLSWYEGFSSVVFIVLFLLVVMTKSAMFPFVSWLLEAMRAPTPVSSLVHSSTLVAAGAWFLFRYENLISFNGCSWLLYFCFVTIILTSVCAMFFMDLKKIVALSTCNNVSWCVLFFISGSLELALIQLLTHGVCKCYLFMSVGDLMSQSGSSQSAVGVYLSRYSGIYMGVVQSFLVFSLCGVPFLGVFFSKHGMFSCLLYFGSLGVLLGFMLCFFLSYVYSVRFSMLLLGSRGGLTFGYSSFFVLICPLILLGTFINLFCGGLLDESVGLGSVWSSILLFLQIIGCLSGVVVYYFPLGFGRWSSLLWGNEGFVSLFYSLFILLSSVCIVSFYRWEVYALNKWMLLKPFFVVFRGSLFSMNVLVLGLLFCLVFSLLLW